MEKYRKKPVVIEAVQLTKQNIKSVYEWVRGEKVLNLTQASLGWWERYEQLVIEKGMDIETLENGPDGRAKHVALIGDYIIRGIQGEFYPCKPDIFQATYEKVLEENKSVQMVCYHGGKYTTKLNFLGEEVCCKCGGKVVDNFKK